MARPHRPRRDVPWAWAVGGAVAGLLCALVLFAPARWLAGAVAGATRGQVLLADPRGTVWDGSARLVLTGGQGSVDAAALPGRVAWRVRPAWGGAAARVEAECCTAQALGLRAQWRLALDWSMPSWSASWPTVWAP